jgi:hypothetical protein
MACNTCNKKTEDCGCKATSVSIDSICNPIDCGSQECSESFPAECILYTGDDIICDATATTIVTSGDSIAQSLANIVTYFCDGNAPDVPADIDCGVDTVVQAGTSVVDALPLIVTYFCDAIDNLVLFASTTSNRIGTVDPSNPLCTDYEHTITYLDSLGVVIATTTFNTRTCEPLLIEDEGVLLTARDTLNFTGTGITATDTGTEIEVNVPGPTTYGLFAQTADSAAIFNTTTPGTLIGAGVGSLTVPADTFQIGDSFRGEMFGNLLARNNDSVTIRIKFNAVTVLTLGPILMPSVTSKKFLIETYFTVRTIGATGTVLTGLKFQHESDAADKFNGHATTDEIAFDTTTSNTLDIELEWSAADILNSITSQTFTLTKTY